MTRRCEGGHERERQCESGAQVKNESSLIHRGAPLSSQNGLCEIQKVRQLRTLVARFLSSTGNIAEMRIDVTRA
jgi:hypothetical protein